MGTSLFRPGLAAGQQHGLEPRLEVVQANRDQGSDEQGRKQKSGNQHTTGKKGPVMARSEEKIESGDLAR